MKKVLLSVLFIAAFSVVKAQKGNNQIGVAAEVGIPTGDFGDAFKTGFGGSVKGLYGVGTAGQITFTTGYTGYKAKESTSDYKATWGIIPLLAGYRHNFSGFYLEPQAGLGIYTAKVTILGQSGSDNTSAFTWAVGAGYAMNGVDVGVRYQGASKDGDNISLIGIHVGYNFSLGGGNSKK